MERRQNESSNIHEGGQSGSGDSPASERETAGADSGYGWRQFKERWLCW